MLIILCVGLATYLSCSYADEIFPEALVFEELGLSDIINNSKSDENHNNTVIIAGDLNDALTTMNFHRKNINDYLCRQYVVEEILKDITDSASSESRSMSQDSRGTSKTSIMQTDQGSSAYNAWLIKTKLLKKIYDEYDLNVRMHEKPVGFTLKNKNNESLGTHDYETMKNVDDKKDLKKPYHSNEDSFSSPSDTVSVDFTQSQSTQYDIDNDNEYKKSNQPYHGLHNFNSTQSTYLPPSAYEPSFPPSTYGPPLLPTNYGSPPFFNETPSYPLDYGMPPLLSYGPPSTPHESYSSPTSHGSSAPINGHSILPPLNNRSPNYLHPGLIPLTEYPGSDLTIQNIKTLNQFEDEDHTPDTEPKRGLTATDMYDLTLTAIAFLGFGTFVIHLVMDAMMVQSGATLTINSSPLHGATVSRVKRHDNSVFWEINELSWTIVSTIDNMMANVDGTFVNCKEVTALCRRSKKLVKTGTNFSSKLLPVWNVALGWLSNKLSTDKSQPVISALLGHCILPSQCQKNA